MAIICTKDLSIKINDYAWKNCVWTKGSAVGGGGCNCIAGQSVDVQGAGDSFSILAGCEGSGGLAEGFVDGVLTYNNALAVSVPALLAYFVGPASGYNPVVTYISFYIDAIQKINLHQPTLSGSYSYAFNILPGTHVYSFHAQVQVQSAGPCPGCHDPVPVVSGAASYSGTFTYPNV